MGISWWACSSRKSQVARIICIERLPNLFHSREALHTGGRQMRHDLRLFIRTNGFVNREDRETARRQDIAVRMHARML